VGASWSSRRTWLVLEIQTGECSVLVVGPDKCIVVDPTLGKRLRQPREENLARLLLGQGKRGQRLPASALAPLGRLLSSPSRRIARTVCSTIET